DAGREARRHKVRRREGLAAALVVLGRVGRQGASGRGVHGRAVELALVFSGDSYHGGTIPRPRRFATASERGRDEGGVDRPSRGAHERRKGGFVVGSRAAAVG